MNLGIWIDSARAYLWRDNRPKFLDEMQSDIENYHVRGGYGSAVPFGPQDAVSEPKLTRRRSQQFNLFFSRIISKLQPADTVYILGPGQTRIGLQKAIMGNTAGKAVRIAGCDPADSMTNNQIMAAFREFFSNVEGNE